MVASSSPAEPDEVAFANDLKYLAHRKRSKAVWRWYCRVSIAALLALTLYHVL